MLGILVRPFAASHISRNNSVSDERASTRGGFTSTLRIAQHPGPFSIIDEVMMTYEKIGKIPFENYPKTFLYSHFNILSNEEVKLIANKHGVDVNMLKDIFNEYK